MLARRLRLFSALLLIAACVARPSQPRSDSFAGPATLTAEAFSAATVADLRADDESDGREAVAVNVPVAPIDTFSTPPSMAAADFAAATRDDLERDAEPSAAPAAATAAPAAKPAASAFQITLHRDWVEKVKNKATIRAADMYDS